MCEYGGPEGHRPTRKHEKGDTPPNPNGAGVHSQSEPPRDGQTRGSAVYRGVQAEPNKKATSVRSPALLASVFSRLAVFVCAKNSIQPKEQKKFQPNRSEGKKVTSILIFSVVDMDQTAAKIT